MLFGDIQGRQQLLGGDFAFAGVQDGFAAFGAIHIIQQQNFAAAGERDAQVTGFRSQGGFGEVDILHVNFGAGANQIGQHAFAFGGFHINAVGIGLNFGGGGGWEGFGSGGGNGLGAHGAGQCGSNPGAGGCNFFGRRLRGGGLIGHAIGALGGRFGVLSHFLLLPVGRNLVVLAVFDKNLEAF